MIGREVIIVKEHMSLQQLYAFMDKHWDREAYGGFAIGRPTPASIEEYILLPCTRRFGIIAYTRAKGGLFNKDNKVILSVCDNVSGAWEMLYRAIPTKNIFTGINQIANTVSVEKERKGPAQEVLLACAAHMKELLTAYIEA